jgi:pSer/pThr/pTyr-binding forkhead associated (FHA) protein
MNYQLIKIGRSADNDVKLSHASVSRHHAEIFVDTEGNVFVRDLNSSNGTFVNDVKIEGGKELKPGDVVRVGVEDLVEWQKMVQPVSVQARKITGDQSESIKSKPRKRQLAIILSFFAIVLLGVGFFVFRSVFTPPTVSIPVDKLPKTQEPQRPQATIHSLENASLEELNNLKNAEVTDFKGDTTLNSKREKGRQLVIKAGVFTMHSEKIDEGGGKKEKKVEKTDKSDESGKSDKSEKDKNKDKQEKKKSDEVKQKPEVKSQSGESATHTWRKGDSLKKIVSAQNAKGCRVNENDILDDNKLDSESQIKEGQELIIKCRK